jgi:hypothetical protein
MTTTHCIRDDSAECDCPRCSDAEKRFWSAQGVDRADHEDKDAFDDGERSDAYCTCVTFKMSRDEDAEHVCPWCGRLR